MAELVGHSAGLLALVIAVCVVIYHIYNKYRDQANHIVKMVTTNLALADIGRELDNNKMYWEILTDFLVALENNHKNNAWMAIGNIVALARVYITNNQKLSVQGKVALIDIINLLEKEVLAELVKAKIQTGTPIYIGLITNAIRVAVDHNSIQK